MLVMLANNTGAKVHGLAHRFPGHVGHLYSPGAFRGPYPHLPYAVDNGAFAAWSGGAEFDGDAFMAHAEHAARCWQKPRWVLVPDVVADREATLRSWDAWYPRLQPLGVPLAFAAQDGMTSADVPDDADLVFIGGTTEWKWATLPSWCELSVPIHVGRVNSPRRLHICLELGAVSVDGTGWCRGDRVQWDGLVGFLREITGDVSQGHLFCPRFKGGDT